MIVDNPNNIDKYIFKCDSCGKFMTFREWKYRTSVVSNPTRRDLCNCCLFNNKSFKRSRSEKGIQ